MASKRLPGVLASFVLAALAGGWIPGGTPSVWAQQPTIVVPGPGSSAGGNASGTIGVTNTFQSVFSATSSGAPRKGCLIVNYGTATMWVTEGLGVAASTKAKSVQLAVGQAYHCSDGVLALQGEIDITGTATDAFYAAQY